MATYAQVMDLTSFQQDLLNTLNVSGHLVEISFADVGTSAYNMAQYYDEFTELDLEFLLKQKKNLSFLNCISKDYALVPLGTKTKRVTTNQCIRQKNIISFDIDAKDCDKSYKEKSREEKNTFLNKLCEQLLKSVQEHNIPVWLVALSGNGFHIHFRTEPPLSFKSPQEYKLFYDSVREYLEGLIPSATFDPACNNIARLIRLPLSTNWKDAANPVATEIILHNQHIDATEFLSKIFIKEKEKKTPQTLGKKDVENSLTLQSILNHFQYSKRNSIDSRGDKIICSSPFSEDKTPSFHYDNTKKQFFDFSTGKGGDLFHLIAELAQMDIKADFPKVIKIAESITGVRQSPRTARKQRSEDTCFALREDGVYYVVRIDDEEHEQWICSPLEILACSRDYENNSWGRLLSFKDRDGMQKLWSMPMEALAGDGIDVRKHLLRMGLEIAIEPKQRGFLLNYINNENPKKCIRCTEKIGWHAGQFVLPGKVFGQSRGEDVVFQGDICQGYSVSGSLQDWIRNVAEPCQGHHVLVSILCFAFAPPLLALTGEENGGLHLVGPSSIGKTIALKVAASVWGNPGLNGFMHKWRATVNGLEAIAESRNDSLLILDEIGEISPKDAGLAVYMLGNGTGKRRAGKEGGIRQTKEWRTLVLSSGEIGLATHLLEENRNVRGGQEVRFIDLHVESQPGAGILSYAVEDQSEFIELLKRSTERYYGSPIHQFLEKLTEDLDASKRILAYREDFCSYIKNSPKNGQIRRVAQRFALALAAGQLAAEYGILPFSPGELIESIVACFDSWLENKNGFEDSESEQIIAQLRIFLQTYGTSHFPLFDALTANYDGRFYGFRKINSQGDVEWFVLNGIFRQEVCRKFDYRLVMKILKQHKIIKIKGEHRSSSTIRCPHIGLARFYHIDSRIMEL